MKRGIHPVIRAEQALLGSVLADPGGQGWLLDLVDASDLIRPYHAQVLAAMNRVRGRGATPGATAVREEIRTDPDMPSSVSGNAVLLADLMDAAPRSEHGPAYAAMVISTGIGCRMALAASRMRQAAADGDAGIALRMARLARAGADHGCGPGISRAPTRESCTPS
jgi:replicative DNA helicase